MHFAFDTWVARRFPDCLFERFADDMVVHCRTQRQAEEVLAAIAERMEQVGLRLRARQDSDRHTARTPIVGATTSTPALRSSVTRSDLGALSARTAVGSRRSCRP